MLLFLEIQVLIDSLIHLLIFLKFISFSWVPGFSIPAFRHSSVPCFSTSRSVVFTELTLCYLSVASRNFTKDN